MRRFFTIFSIQKCIASQTMSSRIVCCASRHRGTGTACAGRMQRLCVSQEMFRYLQTGTCTACVGRVLLQKKAAPFGTAESLNVLGCF